jgi:hypothetical protein
VGTCVREGPGECLTLSLGEKGGRREGGEKEEGGRTEGGGMVNCLLRFYPLLMIGLGESQVQVFMPTGPAVRVRSTGFDSG